jgi:peptide/nickel transport system ATP-binding protein
MLDVQDLKVELDGEAGIVKAIDGLRLSIQRGETFALVGESGCGKSMTALALMRLLPENGRITDGTVKLDDTDTLALSEGAMRTVRGGRIGMIFQEPGTSLNPVLRIGDQMVEAIELHTKLRGDQARAKALEWLQRVGIPEPERRIDDYPFRMSGGQKQRVMIAMTLATEPDYLIADEPTTALDVTIQAQVLQLLKQLQQEQGMGMLLITHDLGVVSGMAHRVALMYAGQIVEVATAQDFFHAPRHPYARALLAALPDATRKGDALTAIRGTVPALTQDFVGCRFAPRCDQALPSCAEQVPPWTEPVAGHGVRCVLFDKAGNSAVRDASAKQTTTVAAASAVATAQAAIADGAGQTTEGPDTKLGAAAATVLLNVQGLTVRFPTRHGFFQRSGEGFTAVKDVSFQVLTGSTLALVGESGCGKTTTGKAIVQLLRGTAVMQGQALMGGKNLFDLQGSELQTARSDIQIIFQDPFASLNPRLRVFDILEEGLTALRPDMAAPARRQRIETLCDQVGLRREALLRYPHEFSGGQRQRIAIARALAVQPKLIVCDEPTSALDVSVQAQILNLLRQLQRELGLSYIFITHNIGVVEYIADFVAVMKSGCIVEQGVAAHVLRRPEQAYTKALLAAVPRVTAGRISP